MEKIKNNVYVNLENDMIYFVSVDDKPLGVIEIEGETEDTTEVYFVIKRMTADELIAIGNRAKVMLDLKDVKNAE